MLNCRRQVSATIGARAGGECDVPLSRMHHSHLHRIIDVAVMHVGRIIGIQDLCGLSSEDQIAIGIGRIRRLIN